MSLTRLLCPKGCGYALAFCVCECVESPAPTSTVAPDTGAAASGVMGPVVTPDPTCLICGPMLMKDGECIRHGDLADQADEIADSITCYASTRAEYPINTAALALHLLAARVRSNDAARSAPAVPTGVATTPQGETCAVCGGSGTYADPDAGC